MFLVSSLHALQFPTMSFLFSSCFQIGLIVFLSLSFMTFRFNLTSLWRQFIHLVGADKSLPEVGVIWAKTGFLVTDWVVQIVL